MKSLEKIANKNVLVTGAAGTVGRALLSLLHSSGASALYGVDNNEAALFQSLQDDAGEFSPILTDVRDQGAMIKALRGVDIVFHLAAVKHVGFSETTPMEAVKTNILGVSSVIDAALECDVEQVINTSTDKAVNPFSVMGASKLMGEQLIRAANLASGSTRFSSTRFGNVLGSSGSVVPVFRRQLEQGQPVTITSTEMTRFVMTLDEAAGLVLESVGLAKGGETFITKMKTIRVEDLATIMIQKHLNIHDPELAREHMVEIGPRPGEKFYEELMCPEEVRRCEELAKYFVIYPAMTDVYSSKNIHGHLSGVEQPYNSATQQPMTAKALLNYLEKSRLL